MNQNEVNKELRRIKKETGYTLERGAYQGTSDDRLDRWYWCDNDPSTPVDRRGPGFATRADAIEARFPG